MTAVVVDGELRARLHGLAQQITFLDEQGQPLGCFLPLNEYRRWLATVEVPFTAEEVEQLRQQTGGSSLKEFWARLEQS